MNGDEGDDDNDDAETPTRLGLGEARAPELRGERTPFVDETKPRDEGDGAGDDPTDGERDDVDGEGNENPRRRFNLFISDGLGLFPASLPAKSGEAGGSGEEGGTDILLKWCLKVGTDLS